MAAVRAPGPATVSPDLLVRAVVFLVAAAPGLPDLATADLATAFPETVAVAMVVQAMVDEATADPQTADPATADPGTVDPETETVDLSTEQAFFARAAVLSDHPVSFDTEARWPTLDLEGREQRRARFMRVVGVIVGTLSVVALFAVTRPGPVPPEAPVSAAAPVSAVVAEIQPDQPTPTLLPELSVSAPGASSSSAEPAPSSVIPPARVAPAASVAPSRKRAPRNLAATPIVPAESGKRPPPTARFAD